MYIGIKWINYIFFVHSIAKFPCSVFGCMLEFDSLLQYEMHYNSSHRYICSECRKRLPSPHLLDLHISETHDSFFLAQTQRNPMVCYIIKLVTLCITPRLQKCISRILGMMSHEALPFLFTDSFHSSPTLAYVNQPKILMTSEDIMSSLLMFMWMKGMQGSMLQGQA